MTCSEWKQQIIFHETVSKVVHCLPCSCGHILPPVRTPFFFFLSSKCNVPIWNRNDFHNPSGVYFTSCGISILLFPLIMALCMNFNTSPQKFTAGFLHFKTIKFCLSPEGTVRIEKIFVYHRNKEWHVKELKHAWRYHENMLILSEVPQKDVSMFNICVTWNNVYNGLAVRW